MDLLVVIDCPLEDDIHRTGHALLLSPEQQRYHILRAQRRSQPALRMSGELVEKEPLGEHGEL